MPTGLWSSIDLARCDVGQVRLPQWMCLQALWPVSALN
jgi:hypothetical protein